MPVPPEEPYLLCLRAVASPCGAIDQEPTSHLKDLFGEQVNIGTMHLPRCRDAAEFCKAVSNEIHSGISIAIHNRDAKFGDVQVVGIVIDVIGADNVINVLVNSGLPFRLYQIKRDAQYFIKEIVRIRPKRNFEEERVD